MALLVLLLALFLFGIGAVFGMYTERVLALLIVGVVAAIGVFLLVILAEAPFPRPRLSA